MKRLPQLGKVHKDFLENIVLSKLNSKSDLLIGPKYGFDNGVIKIDDNKIMVIATDPISIIPSLNIRDSAWLSVHLLASDIMTSGIKPIYASVNFTLPPEIQDGYFKKYWNHMINEFNNLDISVVTGHTGRYDGCNYPIIGSGTLIGIGNKDQYIAPNMVDVGDNILITKSAGIETTAILSHIFPNVIKRKLGSNLLLKAQKYIYLCSTYQASLLSTSIGIRNNGVTSMHDVTEGGVFGALYELAIAMNHGIHIKKSSIPISDETKKICSLFNLNPLETVSEGTLLITVKKNKTKDLIKLLNSQNIYTTIIGQVVPKNEGIYYIDNTDKTYLTSNISTNYWNCVSDYIKKGWN